MGIYETISRSLRPDYIEPSNLFALHYHEIIYSFVFYCALMVVSPPVCRKLFGDNYLKLNKKGRINFDIHIVSSVQCLLSIVLCVPLFLDKTFGATSYGQLFGSDFNHTLVAAVTVGYFIWDFLVCIVYFDLFGVSFLLHAVTALTVFSITFIPFFQYWIPRFLIFELSTPFVNVNWFINKLPAGTVPTKYSVANGICLLVVFFVVRILWGFLALYRILALLVEHWPALTSLLRIVAIVVLMFNFTLDTLNVFWFKKMFGIAAKMARKSKQKTA